MTIICLLARWCPKFTFPTFTPDPNLHFPHLHRTQIYTNPNLHKPRFTPDPNLHSPPLAYPNLHNSNLHKTEPKFTQTQIYTGPNLHSHFWTDFKQPKFTRPKFTQNPNLHNPNLRNPNLHTTKKAKRRSRVRFEPRATFEPGPKGLREPKATFEPHVLEPRATIGPKCMYRCDIISWLVR